MTSRILHQALFYIDLAPFLRGAKSKKELPEDRPFSRKLNMEDIHKFNRGCEFFRKLRRKFYKNFFSPGWK